MGTRVLGGERSRDCSERGHVEKSISVGVGIPEPELRGRRDARTSFESMLMTDAHNTHFPKEAVEGASSEHCLQQTNWGWGTGNSVHVPLAKPCA